MANSNYCQSYAYSGVSMKYFIRERERPLMDISPSFRRKVLLVTVPAIIAIPARIVTVDGVNVWQAKGKINIIHLRFDYLTSVSGTVARSFSIEYFFRWPTINRMTSEVGSKPSGRTIIEETLGHLKTFTFVARVTLVGQFSIQVVKHLKII